MLSPDIQLVLIILGTAVSGFIASALWGRMTMQTTFDRDTVFFLGKMWSGIAGGFLILYFLIKHHWL
jgi:hypothetical protein